jgi:hypothetical protein
VNEHFFIALLCSIYSTEHTGGGGVLFRRGNATTISYDFRKVHISGEHNKLLQYYYSLRCNYSSRKDTQLSQLKKEDTVTTTCVRIRGDIYITAATSKAAVSPITTKTFTT